MCGIAGAVSLKNNSQIPALLQKVLDYQTPRGPDARSLQSFGSKDLHVSLGHNRLSIVDLSSDANQPFLDHTGRYSLVFNGEIYNYIELREELKTKGHIFRTSSDSEVLLEAFKAWGEAAITKFIGMFAFAIADQQTNTVWLCRDRFGVKPLFYRAEKEILYFASTARIIARECGLLPNLQYIAQGIAYQVYENDGAETMFHGLNSVRPGHLIRFDLGLQAQIRLTEHPYYSLSAAVENRIESLKGFDENHLIQLTEEIFTNAVSIRLRTDVPYALSLSGGLDSASVAATALRLSNKKLTGFHFGHPDAAESEGPLVAELEKMCDLDVHYVWPTTKQIIERFDRILAAQESPFGGLSILAQFMVFEAAHQNGFKVLLGGQGGDEAFMGYRKYFLFQARRLRQKNPLGLLPFAAEMAPTVFAELPSMMRYWRFRKKYFNTKGLSTTIPWDPAPMPLNVGADARAPLWHRQAVDVLQTSLPTLLRYEDRNSMSQSIESRLPFMDHRLIELGLALPDRLKLRQGYGKWIIRHIMKGRIPKSISHARFKKGFNVNERRWIKEGLGQHMRDLLQQVKPELRQHLPFAQSALENFSDDDLCQHPGMLADLIGLIWLGQVYKGL